jgi:hypothetical protein
METTGNVHQKGWRRVWNRVAVAVYEGTAIAAVVGVALGCLVLGVA